MYKLITILAGFLVTTLFLVGCDVNIPSGSLNLGGTPGDSGDPPNAVVGAFERNVAVGSRVILDATASSDPDGDLVTCRWQQGSGPVAVNIQTAPGNDCDAYAVPTVEGVYQFIVTVSDGRMSDTQTVEVRVGPGTWDEGIPYADAGVDQTVNEGNNVTLRGGNSADPDGDPLSFEWFQLAGPDVSLSNKFNAEPTFTAPMVDHDADLVFELSVSDGFYRSSDTVVVAVLGRGGGVGQTCETGDDCEEGFECDDGECIEDGGDVVICHIPPGNPSDAHTIVVGESAVPAHLAHGDTLGPCCTTDEDCDDSLFCNGQELCLDDGCAPGTDPCAPDQTCDEEADECVPSGECTTNGDCDDTLFCNGAETCDLGTDGIATCLDGTPPCDPATEMCDEDRDACVECLTDADCDEGEVCVDDGVCEASGRGQLVVANGSVLTALTLDGQAVRWQADAGCNGRPTIVPDGDQSVVLLECSSGTVAFDGDTGSLLWTRDDIPYSQTRDVYRQLCTDSVRYPYGAPNLGGGPAPDTLFLSGSVSARTTTVVDSRTGEDVWLSPRTESTDTRGFQFLATTSGSYDVVFGSAGATGGMFKVDGPTGTVVIWRRSDLSRRWGIPVPDVNGDGQYDFFAAPSYYSDIVMMLDGATGDTIWSKHHGSFDIVGTEVVDDAIGLGVIVGAQGGPLARLAASDGHTVWSDWVHTNNTIMGLMQRTDGLTILSGWRHQGKAVAVDAATGNVLWDDIPADNADFVGIGVPDLTDDGSDDFLALNAGWLRLYDGVSGAEQTWFAPIQASAVAYDSVP